MRRILVLVLVVGLFVSLQGCQMFQKKKTEEKADTSDRAVLENVTPSQSTSTEKPAPQPEKEQPVAVVTPDEPAQPVANGVIRKHVVQKGDTLYKLARFYYGDQKYWRKIWDANKKNIPDPNKLNQGMELIIP